MMWTDLMGCLRRWCLRGQRRGTAWFQRTRQRRRRLVGGEEEASATGRVGESHQLQRVSGSDPPFADRNLRREIMFWTDSGS